MTKAKAADPVLLQLQALRVAQMIAAAILVGFTLWALRRILEPFILALFLLIMIDGLARAIKRRAPLFPKAAALPTAIVLILAVFGLTIWLTVDNATDFATQGPVYAARINTLLFSGAQRLGLAVTPTVTSVVHDLNPARYAGVLAGAFSHFAEAAVFMLIYLGFLLASRPGFAAKADAFFTTTDERVEARRIFERVRRGVESYVWVQTVVGVLITALSAALMLATGLTHVPFWCAIIFLSNYIPAIGAAIGVLFPAAFGLVEFPDLWPALILVGGLEAIHFAVSHVVQPRMQGQSLNLDPIVVLLSLAFWGAVWGVVGAFLSTPLAVMGMAIMAEFASTRPLAVLLSRDGHPYADMEAER
ncbi:MAG TPA: AI-2E family transporter [Phenylobacterium sp.]|jgi:predicted PurR-regulated permease PerM|nr:AI-2E family transporter [Phenylobacterium sp.]